MEAKELMINDWVVYEGDTNCDNPIKIEGMDIATNSLITSDREDVGFDGIEPIPLTAEVLGKNGFGDSFASNEKIFGCEDFEIWIDFKEQGYWACIKNKVSDLYFEGNKRYVHELQHALKLCGITYEISL